MFLYDFFGGNFDLQCLFDFSCYFVCFSCMLYFYGDVFVFFKLYVWVVCWLWDVIFVVGEIDIISGVIDGIERLFCVYLLLGDSVVVEDFCFLSSINMLCYVGFSVSLVSVDSEGMQFEKLEWVLNQGVWVVILMLCVYNFIGCSLSVCCVVVL